jgi:hypothetical protein
MQFRVNYQVDINVFTYSDLYLTDNKRKGMNNE